MSRRKVALSAEKRVAVAEAKVKEHQEGILEALRDLANKRKAILSLRRSIAAIRRENRPAGPAPTTAARAPNGEHVPRGARTPRFRNRDEAQAAAKARAGISGGRPSRRSRAS